MQPVSLNVKQNNQGRTQGLLNIQTNQPQLVPLPAASKPLPRLAPLNNGTANNMLNIRPPGQLNRNVLNVQPHQPQGVLNLRPAQNQQKHKFY